MRITLALSVVDTSGEDSDFFLQFDHLLRNQIGTFCFVL